MPTPFTAKLAAMPSKLPRDFVARTMKRLLPSAEVIQRMTREQLLKLHEKQLGLRKYIESNPIHFFQPSSGGQRAFVEGNDPQKTIHLYLAGNKSGKSTAGAVKFMERILGRPLWGTETRSFAYPVPARGAIFAEDFDSHKETTIPTLMSWVPKRHFVTCVRNPAGHIIEYVMDNGSLIHFRTYDQGSDKAEGKDWDIVWCDEPPPRDIYTAIFRGLVVHNGTLLITATLLKEAWLYDEGENPYVELTTGEIHDNPWLSQSAKENFLNSLTEEERAVRESGRPATLTGVVYKEFRDDPPFVVPVHEVPKDCPIIMAVDPHERKPVHVEYGYVTQSDEVVWFEHVKVSQPVSHILERLAEIESTFHSKPCLCIMDPNSGSRIQLNEVSWEGVFLDAGYNVMLGVDDKLFGISATHEYLAGETPKMRWMETCRGKGGPIHQMLRYAWDDWAKQQRMSRDLKEKTKDQNSDWPDLHRYVAVAQLKYDELQFGAPTLDRKPHGWGERRASAYA